MPAEGMPAPSLNKISPVDKKLESTSIKEPPFMERLISVFIPQPMTIAPENMVRAIPGWQEPQPIVINPPSLWERIENLWNPAPLVEIIPPELLIWSVGPAQ